MNLFDELFIVVNSNMMIIDKFRLQNAMKAFNRRIVRRLAPSRHALNEIGLSESVLYLAIEVRRSLVGMDECSVFNRFFYNLINRILHEIRSRMIGDGVSFNHLGIHIFDR